MLVAGVWSEEKLHKYKDDRISSLERQRMLTKLGQMIGQSYFSRNDLSWLVENRFLTEAQANAFWKMVALDMNLRLRLVKRLSRDRKLETYLPLRDYLREKLITRAEYDSLTRLPNRDVLWQAKAGYVAKEETY
jgi:GGDEF domain-containing protein